MKTDTVMVNKYISLGSVAQALRVDIKTLSILNPAYKRLVVNGTTQAPRRLIVPQVSKGMYTALYDALNNSTMVAPPPVATEANFVAAKPEHHQLYHTVKKGETLADIADTYGVEVQDLKVWNNLHGSKAAVGTKLRLTEGADEPDSQPSPKQTHNYITYKVKRGDTLSSIASKFDGASVEKIMSLNGLRKGMLQPGMTIKISKG
jgi:membrane-bound lytic murein transglycosylase D